MKVKGSIPIHKSIYNSYCSSLSLTSNKCNQFVDKRHASSLQSVSRTWLKRFESRAVSSKCIQRRERYFSTSSDVFKYVLGFESSCDDCGVAIVASDGRVISESLSSQYRVHQEWGGIRPNIATREHRKVIGSVLQDALDKSGLRIEDMSAIAAAVGPGLATCLRIGLTKAQELCKQYKKPFIPINHLEAHAMVSRLQNYAENKNSDKIRFPFLVILLSGGHSQFLLCNDIGSYRLLGGTWDDSLGETYDKVARMLGLGSHGGPMLEKLASEGDPNAVDFCIPMKEYKNCDLSFCGLKSSVASKMESLRAQYPQYAQFHTGESLTKKFDALPKFSPTTPFEELEIPSEILLLPRRIAADVAASFQKQALDHVVERSRRAFAWCRENLQEGITSVVVAGGVAKNRTLRARMSELAAEFRIPMNFPPMKYCTDNGVMIAWTGMEILQSGGGTILTDENEIAAVVEKPQFPLSHVDENVFNTKYPNDIVQRKRYTG